MGENGYTFYTRFATQLCKQTHDVFQMLFVFEGRVQNERQVYKYVPLHHIFQY